MPVEFGTSVNDFTNNIMNNTFIRSTFSNPFYTSILLSIIIVLFIIILGSSELTYTSIVRKTVYIFVILATGLFINNTILIHDRHNDIQDTVVNKTIKLGSGNDYGNLTIKPQSFGRPNIATKNSIIEDLIVD